MPRFTEEELLVLAAAAQPIDGPRVALAGMQKNPPDFIDWMYYHLSVGVWGFIIRFEDPDEELAALLQRLQAAMGKRFQPMPKETTTTDGGLQDVMFRAMNFITTAALPKARELNVDYVLWIDSDELIFPVTESTIRTAFAALPSYRTPGINYWHQNQPQEFAFATFVNYEARFPNPYCEDQPFTTAGTRFQTDHRYFELYTEGKPAAVTKNLQAQATTPHSFSGGDQAIVPPSVAVVLHFDSPGFEPWLKKWTHHAKGDRSKPWDKTCLEKFRYYRESIDVVQRDSTMDEKLRLYSSFRVLPSPEEQATDPKWAGLIDLDIYAKILAGRDIVLGKVAPPQVQRPLPAENPLCASNLCYLMPHAKPFDQPARSQQSPVFHAQMLAAPQPISSTGLRMGPVRNAAGTVAIAAPGPVSAIFPAPAPGNVALAAPVIAPSPGTHSRVAPGATAFKYPAPASASLAKFVPTPVAKVQSTPVAKFAPMPALRGPPTVPVPLVTSSSLLRPPHCRPSAGMVQLPGRPVTLPTQ